MDKVFTVLFILFIVAIIAMFLLGIFVYATKTEVETYTVGCEITQMAYAEETISRSRSKPAYKMGVRNDNFATTFDISAEQFAKYTIGDVVEVKVVVYELFDGTTIDEYYLVSK